MTFYHLVFRPMSKWFESKKRDVGEIENESNDIIAEKCDELKIAPETIPVAILFCRSRGIEIVEPIGEWIHLLKPIRERRKFRLVVHFAHRLGYKPV